MLTPAMVPAQNAYSQAVAIQPSASSCRSPACSIANLQSFCQSPNAYGNDSCTNTAGPGTIATASTRQFKSACPDAYSYSKGDATSTFVCKTGTDYAVIFCP